MTKVVKQAQIEQKDFPECVRIRRGMYISNLNQMVTEIVDNSVDEHFAGYCNAIAVAVIGDTITVQDNGRGIPVTPLPNDPNKTQVEQAFTTLHAGGKFGGEGGYSKKTSGMHGVGGSCVQALSESMSIEISCYGQKHRIDFEKGYVTEKTRVIEELEDPNETGTSVSFIPDKEIWKDSDPLNIPALKRRLKQIAYLNPGLTIYMYIDTEGYKFEESFLYPEGLKTYVEELTAKRASISDVVGLNTTINEVDVQIAMAYTEAYNTELYSFCNNMATIDNGDHLTGFTMGINQAVKKYMEQYKIDFELKSEDVKEGLVGVISVRVADPIFEGQAKTKLKMISVRNIVKGATEEVILDFFDKNPNVAKAILNKIELASKARIAAQKARESQRKSKSSTDGNSVKLSNCSSKNPAECEIFIVEGDSAGGTAKQGRDRRTQAILPIFGKILNAEKQRLEKILDSDKIKEFSKASKIQLGEHCDPSTSKYHKIIIMTDADVDGAHIGCLWLTLFYRYMRPIIEEGFLYFACPPLYKMTYKNGKNVQIVYAYSDEELNNISKEKGTPFNIQRFKGLGEMNADQIWDTTMNPETRKLVKVTAKDAEAAEEYISLCMSDNSNARREWIMENSEYANVDI